MTKDSLESLSLPAVLSVVEVPLVNKGNNTNVGTSRDDFTLGFGVRASQTSLDHLLSDLGLGFTNRSPRKVTNGHDTVVEALLVSKVLGLGKFVLVTLRLNLELSTEDLGGHIAVFGSSEYWNGVDGSPFGLNFVHLGLLTEVHKGSVVIGGVGWDRSNNTGTLPQKN